VTSPAAAGLAYRRTVPEYELARAEEYRRQLEASRATRVQPLQVGLPKVPEIPTLTYVDPIFDPLFSRGTLERQPVTPTGTERAAAESMLRETRPEMVYARQDPIFPSTPASTHQEPRAAAPQPSLFDLLFMRPAAEQQPVRRAPERARPIDQPRSWDDPSSAPDVAVRRPARKPRVQPTPQPKPRKEAEEVARVVTALESIISFAAPEFKAPAPPLSAPPRVPEPAPKPFPEPDPEGVFDFSMRWLAENMTIPETSIDVDIEPVTIEEAIGIPPIKTGEEGTYPEQQQEERSYGVEVAGPLVVTGPAKTGFFSSVSAAFGFKEKTPEEKAVDFKKELEASKREAEEQKKIDEGVKKLKAVHAPFVKSGLMDEAWEIKVDRYGGLDPWKTRAALEKLSSLDVGASEKRDPVNDRFKAALTRQYFEAGDTFLRPGESEEEKDYRMHQAALLAVRVLKEQIEYNMVQAASEKLFAAK
jgi:hypothetical protein